MKKRILLIDESLTVQKVVSLTLDKGRFTVAYAKSRSEAMAAVADAPPDLILVSDQVTDVTVASFPKEVEAWLPSKPPVILIASQGSPDHQVYDAVLRKPFSPQALQTVVMEHCGKAQPVLPQSPTPSDDGEHMQKRFDEAFNDEARLVKETFQEEVDQQERTLLTIPASPDAGGQAPLAESESGQNLWQASLESAPATTPSPAVPVAPSSPVTPKETNPVMGADDSMAYKASLENQVQNQLEKHDLPKLVEQMLERMLPPIVEKIVQERLDALLKEQEDASNL